MQFFCLFFVQHLIFTEKVVSLCIIYRNQNLKNMNRKLLLISNSTNRGESYLDWPKGQIADFLKRHNVKKVLFVPFAGVSLSPDGLEASYNAYEAKVKAVYNELGFGLSSIHHESNPVVAVEQADAAYNLAQAEVEKAKAAL